MKLDRRNFVRESLLLTGAVAVAPVVAATLPSLGIAPPAEDLFARMTWFNEPASWKKSGDQLIVHSRPKTDFRRKTFYGYITDNGHFFYLPASGDFVFEARVNGQYAALYDQAGLMVRLDAENWMKCGAEFVDGKRHASVVFTRDFSDWSTMPDLSDTAPVWWRSIRQGYFPPTIPVQAGIMCAAPEGPGFPVTFSNLQLNLG